ncbi:hypothetical protein BDV32DRAFT_47826 [Aspergillus pseudonomiae]|nr:hypothetical protein BDV32DRAFT_47826 [Aspergillus pseudonomiae]
MSMIDFANSKMFSFPVSGCMYKLWMCYRLASRWSHDSIGDTTAMLIRADRNVGLHVQAGVAARWTRLHHAIFPFFSFFFCDLFVSSWCDSPVVRRGGHATRLSGGEWSLFKYGRKRKGPSRVGIIRKKRKKMAKTKRSKRESEERRGPVKGGR